ncbi:MAG: nuclear transport factor 2 family protein [Pseudoxanthomonas sp.]
MRHWHTVALIAGLLFAPFTANAQQSDDVALAAALKAQADAWDVAIVRKDRQAIAANMSDSFVQIDSDGNAADKAKFLAEITAEDLTIQPYTVEDFRIRLYGDTAIINGRTAMQGTYQGKPFTSHYRFTDVYVKERGGWRVVNIQTTRIK